MKSTSTLLGLTIFYAIVFLFSALEPSSRAVWFAEIIPAIGILIAIWAISIRYQFSNTAYLLMFIWLCLHTIGAKYTFAEVPFDWFNNLIDQRETILIAWPTLRLVYMPTRSLSI